MFLGLFTAILGYPFLHELGHGAAAVLAGATVESFSVFPAAYVLCDVYGVGELSRVFIGVSGMLLPFICAIIIHCKNFWLWYMGLLLNTISIIAFVISVVGCFLFHSNPLPYNDVTGLLAMEAVPEVIWVIFLAFLIIWAALRIFASRPKKRCDEYFF